MIVPLLIYMSEMELTLATVNYNADDFLGLLLRDVKSPVVVVDTTPNKIPKFIVKDNVKTYVFGDNIGHGAGINYALSKIKTEYTLVVDVDCHFVNTNWQESFLKYKSFDIITVNGPPVKPLRPACLFGKTELLKKYDFQPTPGYKGLPEQGFDVGIKAYYEMIEDGLKFKWMKVTKGRYGPARSEEYGFEEPLVYHYWHGSHLHEPDRQKEFPEIDLIREKELFLSSFIV